MGAGGQIARFETRGPANAGADDEWGEDGRMMGLCAKGKHQSLDRRQITSPMYGIMQKLICD